MELIIMKERLSTAVLQVQRQALQCARIKEQVIAPVIIPHYQRLSR